MLPQSLPDAPPLPSIVLVHRCCCGLLRPLSPPVTAAAAVDCRLHQLPPPSAAPALNGRPGGPAATTVGVRGSEDRGNPGRACRNPRGAFPNRQRGLDGPHTVGALRPGDPIFPGGASVKGGLSSCPGAGDNGRTQPGHALALLRPGQRLINPETYICLPGRSACQAPPPGGGYPCQGLRSTALRSGCAVSRPRHSPWGVSFFDWQTKPCERAAKSAGTEYMDLA